MPAEVAEQNVEAVECLIRLLAAPRRAPNQRGLTRTAAARLFPGRSTRHIGPFGRISDPSDAPNSNPGNASALLGGRFLSQFVEW